MCGADALTPGNPALGKFYIVTDGEDQKFWRRINEAGMAMGFADLFAKFHLPTWFMLILGAVCEVAGWVIGKKLKINIFNVKMLTIHRYFSIENARRDLGYEPLVTFEEGWKSTIQWFKENWLPGWREKNGGGGDKKVR
jgi:nucleoside-diphosphate-sugar epimerase